MFNVQGSPAYRTWGILSGNVYDHVWATLSPQRFALRAVYVIIRNPHHAPMKCSSFYCTRSKRNDYSQPSTLLSPASLVNSYTLRVVIGILLYIAKRYADWYPLTLTSGIPSGTPSTLDMDCAFVIKKLVWFRTNSSAMKQGVRISENALYQFLHCICTHVQALDVGVLMDTQGPSIFTYTALYSNMSYLKLILITSQYAEGVQRLLQHL